MKKAQNNKKNTVSVEMDPYQPESIPLFEALYGKNLISLGGLAAVDNMFKGVNIQGLKALDLGFGLGGVAFYLAEKYQMNIVGIEVPFWMVQYAQDHIPKNLSHLLEFKTYNSRGEIPYKPEAFDLVYSKGVLNHVADKQNLFRQIHTVLKPKGLFVIADWIFPSKTLESNAPLICETKESYTLALTHAGFGEIDFRDDSQLFLDYAKQLLINLGNSREFIEQKYDSELFSIIWKQHEALIDTINRNEKFAVRISARKVSV
jgi:2-polyprenyl-3-methyl-5-hydroxy-6-metoxy-1,4-benzoquinol methylase